MFEALVDRILMAAGKRREHQLARIRMARVNGQLIAIFRHAHQIIDVGNIQLGVNALAEQVHRQRDDINVPSALTIAEERAFHPVSSCHHTEFRGGHRRAAIIMRVNGIDDCIAVLDVADRPFNLISVHIGRCRLNSEWQVEDQAFVRRGLDYIHHRLANLFRIIQLRTHETFG